MVTILGLHFRETTNIGDRSCHPLDYFDFSKNGANTVVREDINLKRTSSNAPHFVIVGGGAIGGLSSLQKRFPKSSFIGWGIGSTSRSLAPVDDHYHKRVSKGFTLWGGRDWSAVDTYVPCVSCMSPIFDETFEPKYDVVVYGHASRKSLEYEAKLLRLPYLDNCSSETLYDALSFLASGRIIVTSSYHGAYWGMLLGRRVAVIPFGSKFYNFKHMPVMSENISSGMHVARKFDNFKDILSETREINRLFAQSVETIIDKRVLVS